MNGMRFAMKCAAAAIAAATAILACSDPEIDHYSNPDSDVYLDRLLGIEGALENADSILVALAKEKGCSIENDSGETVACYNKRNDTATVDCMREWLAANRDSLLEANAPSSSSKSGKSSKTQLSSSGHVCDPEIEDCSCDPDEEECDDVSSSAAASSDSGSDYDCELLLEWEKNVNPLAYDEGLAVYEIDGERLVFYCVDDAVCGKVTPGTNKSAWQEVGSCR